MALLNQTMGAYAAVAKKDMLYASHLVNQEGPTPFTKTLMGKRLATFEVSFSHACDRRMKKEREIIHTRYNRLPKHLDSEVYHGYGKFLKAAATNRGFLVKGLGGGVQPDGTKFVLTKTFGRKSAHKYKSQPWTAKNGLSGGQGLVNEISHTFVNDAHPWGGGNPPVIADNFAFGPRPIIYGKTDRSKKLRGEIFDHYPPYGEQITGIWRKFGQPRGTGSGSTGDWRTHIDHSITNFTPAEEINPKAVGTAPLFRKAPGMRKKHAKLAKSKVEQAGTGMAGKRRDPKKREKAIRRDMKRDAKRGVRVQAEPAAPEQPLPDPPSLLMRLPLPVRRALGKERVQEVKDLQMDITVGVGRGITNRKRGKWGLLL